MQGFNMGRYVPPEHEGTLSGNQLAGKHALGARASKLKSSGILTVRFELPFAIWCSACPPETLIGQGVRFNAEKKKVGHYHSTPVYSFRMRHPACGGWFEIRTDPQNTEYVVVEGARRRDYGEWKEGMEGEGEGGEGRVLTEEERRERRENAFAVLEGKVQDKVQAKAEGRRIEELVAWKKKGWEDPYTQNQKLRALFRPVRKLRQEKEAETERVQEKMGLGIELLDGTEDDAKRASFVEFGSFADGEEAALQAQRKPLFQQTVSTARNKSGSGKNRRENPKASSVLAATLQSNTRAIVDPFLMEKGRTSLTASIGHTLPGVKRKRPNNEEEFTAAVSDFPDTNDASDMNNQANASTTPKLANTLVAYDSEDD
ncbi:MAG: hypothetical protein Q9165_007862 [Trypethelium subeluteriae]